MDFPRFSFIIISISFIIKLISQGFAGGPRAWSAWTDKDMLVGHALGLAGHSQMAKTGWTSQFGLAGPGQMAWPGWKRVKHHGLDRLKETKKH